MTRDEFKRIIGGEDDKLARKISDDDYCALEPYDFVFNMYSRVPITIDGNLFHELKFPYMSTKLSYVLAII